MENHKPLDNPSPGQHRHRCKKHATTGDHIKTSPATPRKHVTLPNHAPCCSKEANFYLDSEPESPCATPCRKSKNKQNDDSGELLIKCSAECPGHRKHSLCERRDSGDSPRPLRFDQSDDTRPSRSKHRHAHRKQSDSPVKHKIEDLHEALEAVTDPGLCARQYHSTSHLSELKHKEPSPGIKNRDFSMSHINNNKPLSEEELRLVPLKPRSNSSSRSASPLRTIRHHVRIERWEKITDGELNVTNMCKKFDLTGFSHNVMEVAGGEPVKTDVSAEVRKAGLVSGKVWIKMYGRQINLLAGDILEIPPNQAHKAVADDDSVIIIGQKASCCIS